MDFVERLAAIIPEPWTNLTRYHGFFAPGHGWRDFIVPGRRLLPRPLEMNCDMGASSDDGDDAPINKNSSSGRAHAEYWLPWAKLLRKTFGVCPERCTCGAKMSVRDVTTDREDFIFFLPFHITGIGDMMTRMGLASTAPPLGRIAEAPGELQYLFED